MALKRLTLAVILVSFLSLSVFGLLAYARRDDDHCHYIDQRCTARNKTVCQDACAKAGYFRFGGLCVPDAVVGSLCCCIFARP